MTSAFSSVVRNPNFSNSALIFAYGIANVVDSGEDLEEVLVNTSFNVTRRADRMHAGRRLAMLHGNRYRFASNRQQIIFGTYVGVNDVNGIDCDHLAFSSRDIDLQLWLDRSGKPVPLKIVINYRAEPGSPEYIAVLSNWKFPKQISDSHFEPQLPKDAKRIEFLKVKESQP